LGFVWLEGKFGKGENKISGNLCFFSAHSLLVELLCARFSASPLFYAYLDFGWVMVFVIAAILFMYS
jgi:hypothetical protein